MATSVVCAGTAPRATRFYAFFDALLRTRHSPTAPLFPSLHHIPRVSAHSLRTRRAIVSSHLTHLIVSAHLHSARTCLGAAWICKELQEQPALTRGVSSTFRCSNETSLPPSSWNSNAALAHL